MFQPTVIPLRQADLGRRFDQGLFVLVVVAIGAAWLAEPFPVLRFAALVLLLALSWFIPRLLNARRGVGAQAAAGASDSDQALLRAGACKPASLCAQTRVRYDQARALRIDAHGALSVQWEGAPGFSPVVRLRVLRLGNLVQLAFSTRSVPIQQNEQQTESRVRQAPSEDHTHADSPVPLENPQAIPITAESAVASTDQPVRTLSGSTPLSASTALPGQQGSCLLWLGRFQPEDAAVFRRWLHWYQRGEGSADRT